MRANLIFIYFIILLYAINNYAFIYEINLDKQLIGSFGELSGDALIKLIKQAIAEKKITDTNLSNPQCLKVTKIPIVGSYNTLQLFSLSAGCGSTPQEYIVKEARDGEAEAKSLNSVANFPSFKELRAPAVPPANALSLALPLYYLAYYDHNNEKHTLTLMPKASGRILCDVVKDVGSAQSAQDRHSLAQAYRILGRQLADFHRRNMKAAGGSALGSTALHGDLHCLNIFYDKQKKFYTLIDNETIEKYLNKPQRPDDDILKLFFGLISSTEPESRKNMINNIDSKTWYNTAFANFIDGYVEAFPAAMRSQVLKDLQAIFNQPRLPSWARIDTAALAQALTYINNILKTKISINK